MSFLNQISLAKRILGANALVYHSLYFDYNTDEIVSSQSLAFIVRININWGIAVSYNNKDIALIHTASQIYVQEEESVTFISTSM